MRKGAVVLFGFIILLIGGILLLSSGFIGTESKSAHDNPLKADVDYTNHRTIDPVRLHSFFSVSSVTLAAVGDILIHDTVYQRAASGNGTYDFNPLFKQVKPYLDQADITIANQETMIGGTAIGLSSYPSFNSPFEIGDALKNAGVDVVSIANNHTLDRGEKAIFNAITYWEKIGMVYTGSYKSKEDQAVTRIVEKNNISLAFLSYTYGTNGIPVPAGKPYLVNLINPERIKRDIKDAEKKADAVVVSLHFGNEYQRLPSAEQKQLVKEVADAGADVILGHHPHVLQPFEWLERSNGERTFVAYSLGNFLSGQHADYKDIGGILQLHVEKSSVGGEKVVTVKNPSFISTYVDQNFVVHPIESSGNTGLYKEINAHMNQWIPELTFNTK
nr:CapA family protein [Pseudalkalibacillus caeni]